MTVHDVRADRAISPCDHERAESQHAFLPIHVSVRVLGRSSAITLTSPSDYDLDVLVRIGNRAFLVELAPNGGAGSVGSLLVPEKLTLPARLSLQACLRPGDEQ